ncbi:hypothetical protein LINPERPRIM_LOCUS32033 [Linum perenne]
MSSTPPRDLSSVASETKRIITAHSLHFTALSILFVLPLSLLKSASPIFIFLLRRPSAGGNYSPVSLYLIILGFSLFTFVFEIVAVGSITDSVIHAFLGRPTKLIPTVKSTLCSFFLRLSLTLLIVNLVNYLISILLDSPLYFLIWNGIGPNSPLFIAAGIIHSIVLGSIHLYLQMSWALASTIVVVESEIGVSALKRSSYLVKGKWPTVLFVVLLSNGMVALLSTLTSVTVAAAGIAGGWKTALLFVALTALTLAFLTLFLLCFFVVETVLYLYCKAARGELASDSLPLLAPSN